MATGGTVGKADKGEVLGARGSRDFKEGMSECSKEVRLEPPSERLRSCSLTVIRICSWLRDGNA